MSDTCWRPLLQRSGSISLTFTLREISGRSLYRSTISATTEPGLLLSLQFGPMTSRADSTIWTSGISGISSTRTYLHLLRPHVTDATIPVINYTEVAMSSISTVFQARTILKSNIKNLTAERALFARYLVHLVGDIHQPLHSVSLFNHTFPNGDRGGNLLKLKILNGTT